MNDLLIAGAGASGLMAASVAATRGLKVSVVDGNETPLRKLNVCGGGFGNFANLECDPLRDYYTLNPGFTFSALKRFDLSKVCRWVESLGLDWEVRDGNCCFCVEPIRKLSDTLVEECQNSGVEFILSARIGSVERIGEGFRLCTDKGSYEGRKLLIATGGCSYPQLGATAVGMKLAESLGHSVNPPKSALAPLRFAAAERVLFGDLSGIALETIKLTTREKSFTGSLVFRPDGLGGIAVFKAATSWAWHGGELTLDFSLGKDLTVFLTEGRCDHGTQTVKNRLAQTLPRRLVTALCAPFAWSEKTLAQISNEELLSIRQQFHAYRFTPSGTGDFPQAEAMLGGVDTREVSSKTFESSLVPGLYFAGEVLDVTGQLGGYNLHWAFASGHAVGEAV